MKKLKISILLVGIMLLIIAIMSNNVLATDNTSETLNFQDQNLQKAFLEIIGKNENEALTMGDIKNSITSKYIDLSNKGISDLTGIENVLNELEIEGILLCNNQITNISPLSSVKTLKSLWIKSNKITDISALSNLIQLYDLRAEENKITDISSLKNLKNLNTIYLDNNNISDISVLSNFSNLEVLSMGDNQIKDISAIAKLNKLSYVSLDNNQIRNINGFPANSIINSSDDVNSYQGWGHIVNLQGNYINFEEPHNKEIKNIFEKASWANNFEEQDGDVFQYMPQKELIVTAIIDIVDKNEDSQPRAGDGDYLYSMIDVPTGLIYEECYYRLYFDEYVGKSLNVEGLGNFVFDKKDNVATYGENYIYKCKITNPKMFYKAGTHEYSVTYTVEETNKTYTTKLEINVTGLEIETYEVKADKKVSISLTGAMGDKNNLVVNTIDKQDKTYVEMMSILSVDKENIDVYAYDINVEGEYEGELTLTFDVGEEYNGKKANVLHRKKDDSSEKFEAIVENGKVTVTVSSLSPFLIAIEDNNVNTENTTEENKEHKLDETPKTGTIFETTSILSIIALISLVGISITNKYIK